MRLPLSSKLWITTAIAFYATLFAISHLRFKGISTTNTSAAAVIRSRAPIRLVQPEWVSSTPDTLSNWLVAEIYARVSLVSCLWLLAVIFILRHHRRKS